jgi:hypothetical protein
MRIAIGLIVASLFAGPTLVAQRSTNAPGPVYCVFPRHGQRVTDHRTRLRRDQQDQPSHADSADRHTGAPLFGGYPVKSLKDLPAGDYWAQAFVNVYTEFVRADGHTVWLHRGILADHHRD